MSDHVYHVFNGDHWAKFADLSAAKAHAEEAIDICRDHCDPEWPGSVEQIAIYYAPSDCAGSDEDGELVLIATEHRIETDRDPAHYGVDYWCDYSMQPPVRRPAMSERDKAIELIYTEIVANYRMSDVSLAAEKALDALLAAGWKAPDVEQDHQWIVPYDTVSELRRDLEDANAEVARLRARLTLDDALADLRNKGWMVAVHNDYRIAGEPMTFWLFTHPSGRWAKGEGKTDAEALAALSAYLGDDNG